LNLGIPNLDIPIGKALVLHLGNVTLQPTQPQILKFDIDNIDPDKRILINPTITANLFGGLQTIPLSVTDLNFTNKGFTLGSFDIHALGRYFPRSGPDNPREYYRHGGHDDAVPRQCQHYLQLRQRERPL
jgi:hypothetical protein